MEALYFQQPFVMWHYTLGELRFSYLFTALFFFLCIFSKFTMTLEVQRAEEDRVY